MQAKLTAEALEHYAEHGYCIVEDAISQGTLAELNRIFDLRLRHESGGLGARCTSTGWEKFDFSDGQPFLRSALQPTVVRLPRGAAETLPPPTCREYVEPVGWSAHLAEQGGSRSLAAFRDLIEPAAIAPILAALLGDPRWGHAAPDTPVERRGDYRLDHDCKNRLPLSSAALPADLLLVAVHTASSTKTYTTKGPSALILTGMTVK